MFVLELGVAKAGTAEYSTRNFNKVLQNFRLQVDFFFIVKSALPLPLDKLFDFKTFQLANQNTRPMRGGDVKLHVRVLTIDISASHSSQLQFDLLV